MIRRLIDQAFNSGKYYISAVGLSTDVKPTEGIITGSKFVEVDTGIGYLFDETSGEWHENTQLSEAVAAYLDEHPEALDEAAIEAIFDERLDGIENEIGGLKSAFNISEASTDKLVDTLLDLEKVSEPTLTGISGIVSKDGAINTGAAGFVHYFITVTPGQVYSITSQEQSGSTYPFVLFYNDDTIVGYAGKFSGDVVTRTIIIPSGVNKLCINGWATSTKCYLCNAKTINDVIDGSGIDEVHDVLSENVILYGTKELKTITSASGWYKADGTLAQYTAQHIHYDVVVEEFQKYQIVAYWVTTFPSVLFYDADGNLLDTYTVSSNGSATKEIIVPRRAVKMAINHYVSNNVQAVCYQYPIENISDEINDINGAIKTISVVEQSDTSLSITPENGYYLTDGTIGFVSASFNHYTIKGNLSKKYRVDSNGSGDSRFPKAIFFNSSGTVISYIDSDSGFKSSVINVPPNATKIGFNHYPTSTAAFAFKLYPYVIGDTEELIEEKLSNWKGKKIVWFGTSIPAGVVNAGGEGGNGSYPARIGEMLGATVYNESVGSSCVRGGSHEHITTNDPMGWADMHVLSIMYSLSLSSSEKQTFMDNWDSKWKDIVHEPQMYDATKADTYKAASWDIKLAKYLSGGSVGQCDLYVIDHGYNDYVYGVGFTDLDEEPPTENDRTYWFGAMDFIVRKILNDNPKAHILLIGHYSNGAYQFSGGANFDMKYICEAQKKYADRWCINCVPTWNLLGLSSNTITVDGTTKSVIAARYPDKLHPASDLTGMELKRYAEALAPYINMQR